MCCIIGSSFFNYLKPLSRLVSWQLHQLRLTDLAVAKRQNRFGSCGTERTVTQHPKFPFVCVLLTGFVSHLHFYTTSAQSKATQASFHNILWRCSRHDYCFYEMFAETLLEDPIHQNLIYSLPLTYRVASLRSHFSTLSCTFQRLPSFLSYVLAAELCAQ